MTYRAKTAQVFVASLSAITLLVSLYALSAFPVKFKERVSTDSEKLALANGDESMLSCSPSQGGQQIGMTGANGDGSHFIAGCAGFLE